MFKIKMNQETFSNSLCKTEYLGYRNNSEWVKATERKNKTDKKRSQYRLSKLTAAETLIVRVVMDVVAAATLCGTQLTAVVVATSDT